MVVKATLLIYSYQLSQNKLAISLDISARHDFFASFSAQYQNMTSYGIWFMLQLETHTDEEKPLLGIKLSQYPPMVFNLSKKYIKHVEMNYPWSVSPRLVFFILIAWTVIWVVVLISFPWHICQLRSHVWGFKHIMQVFCGKEDPKHHLSR